MYACMTATNDCMTRYGMYIFMHIITYECIYVCIHMRVHMHIVHVPCKYKLCIGLYTNAFPCT